MTHIGGGFRGSQKVGELPTHTHKAHTHIRPPHSCIRRKLVATLGNLSHGWSHTGAHTHGLKLVINVYRYYIYSPHFHTHTATHTLSSSWQSFRWLQTMKCKQITSRKLHNMAAKNVDLWVPSGNIIKTMTLLATFHRAGGERVGKRGKEGEKEVKGPRYCPQDAARKCACLLAELLVAGSYQK